MDKSVNKALAIIECLALGNGPRGVSELAREIGLTKSNIHRLLQTLEMRGYVSKAVETSKYDLTLKLWELGMRLPDRLDIKRIALPVMSQLAEDTRETVNLSVLSGFEVIYVDKIDSPEPVRAHAPLGGRAPAYCVATGKVLLAHLPPEKLDGIEPHLVRHTSSTIATVPDLHRALAKIREAGFGISRGELRDSVWGVAAPILDSSGRVVAAIGISGPATRLRARQMAAVTPIVMAAAQTISRNMGYGGPMHPVSHRPPASLTMKEHDLHMNRRF